MIVPGICGCSNNETLNHRYLEKDKDKLLARSTILDLYHLILSWGVFLFVLRGFDLALELAWPNGVDFDHQLVEHDYLPVPFLKVIENTK